MSCARCAYTHNETPFGKGGGVNTKSLLHAHCYTPPCTRRERQPLHIQHCTHTSATRTSIGALKKKNAAFRSIQQLSLAVMMTPPTNQHFWRTTTEHCSLRICGRVFYHAVFVAAHDTKHFTTPRIGNEAFFPYKCTLLN